jgi:MFS family permease
VSSKNSNKNDVAPKSLTHKEIMFVLSGLMVGLLLAAVDQTIVSTALKSIVEDFDGLAHYTWVVTAYLLTSTASTDDQFSNSQLLLS